MQIGLFYSRQVNLVSKTPCFTHGPDQNSVPVCKNPTFTHGPIIPCVKSQHLLTTLAKMAFPYAKRPVVHTASKSRKQNPVFYTRPDNPVCKNPTFTHGKLAPCVKRPILLTASGISCVKPRVLLTVLTKLAFACVKRPLLLTARQSRVQNPVFYSRS